MNTDKVTPLPMPNITDGVPTYGTITSIVTKAELQETIDKLNTYITELQQQTESHLLMSVKTLTTDISNLKDKTDQDIIDLQQALKSSITTSQNSISKLTAITDSIRNDISTIKDSLLVYTDILSNHEVKLSKAFIYIYGSSALLLAETSYLLYKFL